MQSAYWQRDMPQEDKLYPHQSVIPRVDEWNNDTIMLHEPSLDDLR